jgi:hypothetical protein
MLENDEDLLSLEICFGGNNVRIDPVQVFEQPYATGAMHGGQVKLNMGLRIIPEPQEFFNNILIVEVSKPAIRKFPPGFDTGCFVKIIIIAKACLIQEQVHLFAALTAERFVISQNQLAAGIPAVITNCCSGSQFFNHPFR